MEAEVASDVCPGDVWRNGDAVPSWDGDHLVFLPIIPVGGRERETERRFFLLDFDTVNVVRAIALEFIEDMHDVVAILRNIKIDPTIGNALCAVVILLNEFVILAVTES